MSSQGTGCSVAKLGGTNLREQRAAPARHKREQQKEINFALPDERKYPVPDAAHARNAKARASQQEKAGNLSAADKKKVDAKADKVLKKR